MKTQEQQKSELCDRMMYVLRNNLVSETLMGFVSEYDQITQQKPLSQDPYIDELVGLRLLNILKFAKNNSYFNFNKLRLSECPNVKDLNRIHGFGKKMREEYTEVMTTYEMFDKI